MFEWTADVRYFASRLAILTLLVSPSVGCVRAPAIETRTLPKGNPTEYEFAGELTAVRHAILLALGFDIQRRDRIFDPMFHVSDAANPIFGTEILTLPANKDDLYLQTFGEPLWRSPVYFVRGAGLDFLTDFHVHFSSSAPARTTVKITALKTRVKNGQIWGMGHGDPGWKTRSEDVRPTTVEEYTLLRHFGKILGVTDMPPVLLPAR